MLPIAIEALLALAVLLTTWFGGYVIYRLVTHKSS